VQQYNQTKKAVKNVKSSLVIKPFKLENKVNSAFLSSNSITVHRQYLPIQNNAWTISYCKEGVIGQILIFAIIRNQLLQNSRYIKMPID